MDNLTKEQQYYYRRGFLEGFEKGQEWGEKNSELKGLLTEFEIAESYVDSYSVI